MGRRKAQPAEGQALTGTGRTGRNKKAGKCAASPPSSLRLRAGGELATVKMHVLESAVWLPMRIERVTGLEADARIVGIDGQLAL